MSRQKYKYRIDERTIITFTLDVRRRKSMSIAFVDGEIVVRVPYGVTNKQINDLLISNADWIRNNMLLQQNRIGLPKTYLNGERISLVGKTYVLRFLNSDTYFAPFLDDVSLNVAVCRDYPAEFSRKQIDSFIEKLANDVIAQRMKYCCDISGLCPSKVSLRSMTSRWGSCSANGNISINYKLIQFPVECIDYVCIHELCHLKHMDHSKDFWALVESLCPEWKSLRDRMKY